MKGVRDFAIVLFSSLVIILSEARPLWGKLPNLLLMDNYFCKENETQLSLEYRNIALEKTSMHAMIFSIEYGVNHNFLLGFDIPYLVMGGGNDYGVLGDISAYLKFSIAKAEMLEWMLSGELFFRFATGISSQEGVRWVDGVIQNYSPFATRTTLFAPVVVMSFLFGDFMLNTSVGYKSESDIDEGMLDFVLDYDRIDFQVSVDYQVKWTLDLEKDLIFYFRPAIYLDYKQNLTSSVLIPDSFHTTLELNFRLKNIARLSLMFSVPVYSKTWLNRYQFSVQIGKSF
ncbi:MAG: hypothetical protein A2Y33_13765 [Spirochaetes bacterium GWF1_51_8]|nr:MAG: hypothetical protein A2Y33_13765 [Spirochaetes bacterium GWF1_51_8]